MDKILGKYRNDYDDFFLKEGNDTIIDSSIQIYESYNKQNECPCLLKVINKEKLK